MRRQSFAAVLCLLLGACALSGAVNAPRTYDLGPDAPPARLQPLRPVTVRAAPPFDSLDMHYRLAWRDAAELSAFTQSRWVAPPAELLRKQLLRATGDGLAKCALELELQEFTQVFSSASASEARLELQATLAGPQGRVAARAVRATEANAGADAAGGAAALARAVNAALGELAGWAAAQPACK